tara:strand:+ start:423 stop:719 length:297 start_codon:yes stop_codon:yes gene_type:complete
VNGHRHSYNEIISKAAVNKVNEIDTKNDQYSLGLHLYREHGLTEQGSFDKYIQFSILEVVSPSKLEIQEYKWIHRLRTFHPQGINTIFPFSIPGLGTL